MYYLRARFYNQNTGRFWNQDSYEGSSSDPASLHKYLYANADPVGRVDPSGNVSLFEMELVASIQTILASVEGTIGLAFADQLIHGGNAGMTSIATQAAFGTAFIVAGKVLKMTWLFSGEISALIQRSFPGGIMALRGLSAQIGRPVGIFAALAGKLASGIQRNHLNVAAVFKKIPHAEGLVVALEGKVSSIGSEHWRFHVSLDNWAKNMQAAGRKITVADYFDQALPDALMNAGEAFGPFQALQLAEAAKRQALHYGYTLEETLSWVFSSAKQY